MVVFFPSKHIKIMLRVFKLILIHIIMYSIVKQQKEILIFENMYLIGMVNLKYTIV